MLQTLGLGSLRLRASMISGGMSLTYPSRSTSGSTRRCDMTLINDLHLAHSSMQQTANRARMLREAIWWANLSKAQGTVYIYQDARGLLTLSQVPAAGTLVATV